MTKRRPSTRRHGRGRGGPGGRLEGLRRRHESDEDVYNAMLDPMEGNGIVDDAQLKKVVRKFTSLWHRRKDWRTAMKDIIPIWLGNRAYNLVFGLDVHRAQYLELFRVLVDLWESLGLCTPPENITQARYYLMVFGVVDTCDETEFIDPEDDSTQRQRFDFDRVCEIIDTATKGERPLTETERECVLCSLRVLYTDLPKWREAMCQYLQEHWLPAFEDGRDPQTLEGLENLRTSLFCTASTASTPRSYLQWVERVDDLVDQPRCAPGESVNLYREAGRLMAWLREQQPPLNDNEATNVRRMAIRLRSHHHHHPHQPC